MEGCGDGERQEVKNEMQEEKCDEERRRRSRGGMQIKKIEIH